MENNHNIYVFFSFLDCRLKDLKVGRARQSEGCRVKSIWMLQWRGMLLNLLWLVARWLGDRQGSRRWRGRLPRSCGFCRENIRDAHLKRLLMISYLLLRHLIGQATGFGIWNNNKNTHIYQHVLQRCFQLKKSRNVGKENCKDALLNNEKVPKFADTVTTTLSLPARLTTLPSTRRWRRNCAASIPVQCVVRCRRSERTPDWQQAEVGAVMVAAAGQTAPATSTVPHLCLQRKGSSGDEHLLLLFSVCAGYFAGR